MRKLPPQEMLDRLPRLYETEQIPDEEKVIHLHFFVGPCNWFIAEFDGEDTFYGYANLGDPQMAEWGYISYQELKNTLADQPLQIEWNEHWLPKTFGAINHPGAGGFETAAPDI